MPETTQTPQGSYPRAAEVHHLDLSAIADRLLSQLPGHQRQTESVARESGVSVLVMAMEADSNLPEHSASGVVTVQVIRGHAKCFADGRVFDLASGHIVLFQPGVRHDLRAVEQSVVLLTVTGGDE